MVVTHGVEAKGTSLDMLSILTCTKFVSVLIWKTFYTLSRMIANNVFNSSV